MLSYNFLTERLEMEKTRLSSKGQVILPAAIRASRKWEPGTEFAVEETSEGVLLRPLRPFPATRLEDVVGCFNYTGKVHTIEEMDEAISEEIRARHARG